jgi:glycosyltransferase involved in cell wall biosynthesis
VHLLARQWALPDGAAVIMLPGRITAWKGHALLLEALALLSARQPALSWVCVLVGPSPDGRRGFGQELLRQAERLGLASRLRFAGHCADMPAALALADAVVIPSLKPEPFGRTAVEAQAMRRIVLAAGHGAALETVVDGVTGFLFPPGDAEALAGLLQHALSLDHGARAWLGAQARAHVLDRYTTTAMQQATLDVYEELLPRPFPQRPVMADAGDGNAVQAAGPRHGA